MKKNLENIDYRNNSKEIYKKYQYIIDILKFEHENQMKVKETLETKTNFILGFAVAVNLFMIERAFHYGRDNILKSEFDVIYLILMLVLYGIMYVLMFRNLKIDMYKSYNMNSIINEINGDAPIIDMCTNMGMRITIYTYTDIISTYKKQNLVKSENLHKVIKLLKLIFGLKIMYLLTKFILKS